MKVVATQRGYFGRMREPGDEFDVPDESKASWFEKIKPDDEGKEAPKPDALAKKNR